VAQVVEITQQTKHQVEAEALVDIWKAIQLQYLM
jgi:hypothetical protein